MFLGPLLGFFSFPFGCFHYISRNLFNYLSVVLEEFRHTHLFMSSWGFNPPPTPIFSVPSAGILVAALRKHFSPARPAMPVLVVDGTGQSLNKALTHCELGTADFQGECKQQGLCLNVQTPSIRA